MISALDTMAEQVICPLLTCAQPVGSPCLTADNRLAKHAHVVRISLAERSRRGATSEPKQAPAILGHFVGMDEAETLKWRYDREKGLTRMDDDQVERAVDEAVARIKVKAMAELESMVFTETDRISVTVELVLKDGKWQVP